MGFTSGIRQQQVGMEQAHQAAMNSMADSVSTTPVVVEPDTVIAMEAALTSQVELAGRLIMMATTVSDARLMLVNTLRERIATGTYRVSASDLADTLMCSMRADQTN